MRITGQTAKASKAIVSFPKQCSHKPLVERTLLAFRMFECSISQLKNDSMGWRTFETAVENRLSAAQSRSLRQSGVPLSALTGVKRSN
jgi:hypothetical protein